ncbi:MULTISPECIES: protein kinase [unclassified Streptomyces]|uniref:protein kinase n=1 Tax=unclassified Streptomyces TaxID=2593676 RepID=UPI0035DC538F
MDDYAGRVLADRYRLPLSRSDEYEPVETRAFDTYSGQEVLVRQVPLPEVVDAELLGADDPAPTGFRGAGGAVRQPADPVVRRAVEAAQAAAQVPDHPRLGQVFDVFAEAGSLWIVSEFVAARSLASLLAERPLSPFRAAEIGSDVLAALRALHAHGWTHRNITVRTVLVCDDGRVMLTGLAAGAAEEALCGYVTTPRPDGEDDDHADGYDDGDGYDDADEYHDGGGYDHGDRGRSEAGVFAPPRPAVPPAPAPMAEVPASRGRMAIGPGREDGGPHGDGDDDPYADGPYADAGTDADDAPYADAPHEDGDRGDDRSGDDRSGDVRRGAAPGLPGDLEAVPHPVSHAFPSSPSRDFTQSRTGRPDAIVAYREGARAGARLGEDRRRAEAEDTGSLPVQRPAGTEAAEDADAGTGTGTKGTGEGTTATTAPYAGSPWAKGPYGDDTPHAEDPYEDEDDAGEDDEDIHDAESVRDAGDDRDAGDGRTPPGPASPPRRAYLIGSWNDGPGAGRPVPAGGSGQDALRAESRRGGVPALPVHLPEQHSAGRWDEDDDEGGRTGSGYRGPATPLAAERARQTRIAVVGAVTERWAPEQAGPVHENWQLAPPIGPATDLWALGALLYRAVQGHAPYPEENAAELVQMVCAEPPAFAEECGPLRPVVESLLRQDPTERPDFEELSGWLRSLVRSAPEPEAGLDVVPLPAADGARLPIVRRRGELVRRRRGRNAAHGRHRHTRNRSGRQAQPEQQDAGLDLLGGFDRRDHSDRQDGFERPDEPRAERAPRPTKAPRPAKAPRAPREPKALRTPPRSAEGRTPRRLGRMLLLLILLAMAAAIAYAVMFMPKSDDEPGNGSSGPGASTSGAPEPGGQDSSGSQQPQTSRSAIALAPGYTLRKDAEGFEVGAPKDWRRTPANADRQIRYGGDGFSLLIVPGRDTVEASGDDPLAYQADKELELQQFRDSEWSGSSGLRRIDVGRQAMAEGQFTWQDASGREVYARNLVMVVEGRYHVIQVIGPENRRDKVSDIYEQAISSYRVTS